MIDFQGRVAVITGAGRGLGAAYAKLLASRGASVVVNDLGTDLAGGGCDESLAAALASEINASGGIAAANHDDVSRRTGAASMIDQAVGDFGRIDILINNAGVFLPEHGLLECATEDFERVWNVHVMGTVHSTVAAFPFMKAQSYGRIVNIGSSGGYFGAPGRYEYCTAKGGVHGFTMTFADEARPWGITANIYCPGGFTRPLSIKSGAELEDAGLSVDLAAPLAAWLAHERCPTSGKAFESMCGHSSRIVVGLNDGYFARELDLETVAEHFDEICDDGSASRLSIPDTAPQRAAALMKAFTTSKASSRTSVASTQTPGGHGARSA